MYHVFSWQVSTGSDYCFTGRESSLFFYYLFAFFQDSGTTSPVNRTINTSSTHQSGVRCVDDGVCLLHRYISLDD